MKFWPVSDPDSELTAGMIRIRNTVFTKKPQDQDKCISAATSGSVLPAKPLPEFPRSIVSSRGPRENTEKIQHLFSPSNSSSLKKVWITKWTSFFYSDRIFSPDWPESSPHKIIKFSVSARVTRLMQVPYNWIFTASVGDPRCLSRIWIFSILDPRSRVRKIPGSGSKNFSRKIVSKLSEYNPVCSSRIWISTHSGSRVKKATGPGFGSATLFEKLPSYLENKTKSWANWHVLLF